MDPSYLHAVAEAGIVIGMTLVGFICGLAANVERVARIARIARWKADVEDGSQVKERCTIVKFSRTGAGRWNR